MVLYGGFRAFYKDPRTGIFFRVRKQDLRQGLIPETFSGYKKQRFRWTYGPVQELKRYISLYMPGFLAAKSKLTTVQKIHHLNHGLGYLNIGLGFLMTPLYMLTLGSIIIHGDKISVPSFVYQAGLIYIAGVLLLKLLVYKKIMKCSITDTIGAYIAGNSLNHTYITASLLCLVTREIPWLRTNKFKSLPLGLNALGQVQTEILIGTIFVLIPIAAFLMIPGTGIHSFLAATLMIKSIDYFSAPVLAILSEYDLRKSSSEKVILGKKLVGKSKTI